MPPALIVAGVGAAASIGGAAISSHNNNKAINNATDSSLQANRESIAAQKEMFDKQLAAQNQALGQSLGFQTNALNQGNAFQQQAYNSSGKLNTDVLNRNVAILQPYSATGTAAMNSINALLGLPQQQAYTPKDLSFTPINVAPIAQPTVPTTGTPAPAPATPATPTSPATTPVPAAGGNAMNQGLIDALRAQYQNGGMR